MEKSRTQKVALAETQAERGKGVREFPKIYYFYPVNRASVMAAVTLLEPMPSAV